MSAKKTHRYIIGEHLGRELNAARHALESESKGTHTITPNIRRAHWHGYWTGPRKGNTKTEQTFSLRWLPPIMVTCRKPLETEEATK